MTAALSLPSVSPQRRLCVVDYHLRSSHPSGAPHVPSPAADALSAHIHGWLYHLAYPDERRATDEEQAMAPFGAWLLSSRRHDTVSVRVCWYGEEEAHASIRTLAKEGACVLGGVPYVLEKISPMTRQPVRPNDLLANEEQVLSVRVHTISPVGFHNHTRWHCSLEPAVVLGAAADRWDRIWPGTLPWSLAEVGAEKRSRALAWFNRISVSALSAHSEVVHSCGMKQLCVRGWVEYDFFALRPQPRQLALALLRGAALFGLGARCAYGLGAIGVRVVA